MERLTYTIEIKAPAATVWEILFSSLTFPIWTAPFHEGNHAEGDWSEGSELLVLNSHKEGVVYLVEVSQPYTQLSLKQTGIFKNNQKLIDEPEIIGFSKGYENYYLDSDEVTTLRVEKDANSVQRTFFDHAFPRALEIVKSMAESDDG